MKRGKLEMVYDILTLCLDPHKITQVVQSANLPYYTGKPIINELHAAGYLEIVEETRKSGITSEFYRTTNEGYKYIKMIREVHDKIKLREG